MKTSDSQMTSDELAALQGLGVVPKNKYVQMTPTELATLQGLGVVPNNPYVQMTPKELATLDGGLGQMVRLPANMMLSLDKSALAPAVNAQLATKMALLQQKQAEAVTAPPMPEPSLADKFKEWMKNPLYWVGVAAVVGGGLLLLMRYRKNKAVAQVAAVETLSLEGIRSKRKKRRKSKSKAK